MSVGAIVLLIAVSAIFVFEVISLIRTILKRKKEKKAREAEARSEPEDNKDKEVSVQ